MTPTTPILLLVLAAPPIVVERPAQVELPATSGYGGILVVVEELDSPDYWPGDGFRIELRQLDESNTPIAHYDFVSTYGKFQLEFADLTGDEIPELLLVTGEKRGTSVREEYLTVLRWASDRLDQLLRVQVSGFFSTTGWWYYQRELISPEKDDTVVLRLSLRHTVTDPGSTTEPTRIPKEREKEFRWDASSGVLEMHD